MIYTVAYTSVVDILGVVYSFLPSTVNVPALGWADVTATMTADPNLMRHTRDQTVSVATPLD